MELKVGLRFKDNSSGSFEVTDKRLHNLKKCFVIKFIERPREGELTIAKIENALSYNEFMLSEKDMRELSKVGIIKKID
jgi:hypothetical protein